MANISSTALSASTAAAAAPYFATPKSSPSAGTCCHKHGATDAYEKPTHHGSIAASPEFGEDLLALHLAHLAVQGRHLHAGRLQLELRVLRTTTTICVRQGSQQRADAEPMPRNLTRYVHSSYDAPVQVPTTTDGRQWVCHPEDQSQTNFHVCSKLGCKLCLQALLVVHEDQGPLGSERVDAAAQSVDAVPRVRDHVRVIQVRRQADRRAHRAGGGRAVRPAPCQAALFALVVCFVRMQHGRPFMQRL